MSLNARFTASFDDFKRQVEGANTTLGVFERGVKNAARELTRLEESYSGQRTTAKAVQTAEAIARIGGVTKLTREEIEAVGRVADQATEKLNRIGGTVPAKLSALNAQLKIAREDAGQYGMQLVKADQAQRSVDSSANALIGRLAGLAGGFLSLQAGMRMTSALADQVKNSMSMADELLTTASALDTTVEWLQITGRAARQNGADMDVVKTAAISLADRIAGGDDSLAGAIKRYKLNTDILRMSNPADAFDLAAKSISQLPNSLERANAAQDVFGNSGRKLIPLLSQDYGELRKKIAESGDLLSGEQARLLARSDALWKRLGESSSVNFAQFVASSIKDAAQHNLSFTGMATAGWQEVNDFIKAAKGASDEFNESATDEGPIDRQERMALAWYRTATSIEQTKKERDAFFKSVNATLDKEQAEAFEAKLVEINKQIERMTSGEGPDKKIEFIAPGALAAYAQLNPELAKALGLTKSLREEQEAFANSMGEKVAPVIDTVKGHIKDFRVEIERLEELLKQSTESLNPTSGADADPATARLKARDKDLEKYRLLFRQDKITFEEMMAAEQLTISLANDDLLKLQAGWGEVADRTKRAVEQTERYRGAVQAAGPVLVGGMPLGNPGGFSTVVNRHTMADGGLVHGPTNILAGERGPEAIVPLPRLAMLGGGQTIVHVTAPMTGLLLSSDPAGKRQLKQAVDEAVFGAVKRAVHV